MIMFCLVRVLSLELPNIHLKLIIRYHKKIKIEKKIGSKAKKSKNGSFKITPVYITRFDKEYRVSRTSREYDFLNKKVVIIGLGSVGSFVANNLSKMGIEKLLLIDPDFFNGR